MNIKDLKKAIESLPEEMEVMLESYAEEGLYAMSQSAKVKKVNWQSEEIPEEQWPIEDCLVISDEL